MSELMFKIRRIDVWLAPGVYVIPEPWEMEPDVFLHGANPEKK